MDIDYLINEFDCIVVVSDYCYVCQEKKEDRQVLLLSIHEEDRDLIPFKAIGIPICNQGCVEESGYSIAQPVTLDSAKRKEMLTKIVFGLEHFPHRIMSKDGTTDVMGLATDE